MTNKRISLFTAPFLFFILCAFASYSQKLLYVSTLAGDTANIYLGPDSNAGYHNGAAGNALFNNPTGIALDDSGNVYVTDTYNNVIREINVTTNMVTTVAGDTADIRKGLDSNAGYLDGKRYTARFSNPLGICIDKSGNIYIADTYNNVIREISASTGMVSTYAGRDSAGVTFFGYINGPDTAAEFATPSFLAIDSAGNIYVADNGNNVIREIWASTHSVTTLAGRGPDTLGYINGPIDTAEFSGLSGLTLGPTGSVFVTQSLWGDNAIRRLYHDTVTSWCSFDTIGFDTLISFVPSGYANGFDSVYITGDTIIEYDTINTIAGEVLYDDPAGIAFDTSGNLLVADEYNNVIRLVNPSGTTVSTYAGSYCNAYDSLCPVFMNNWDSLAVFSQPIGIAVNKKNNTVYVTDAGNNLIRKIALQSITSIQQVNKPSNTLSVYPNPCINQLNILSSINGSETPCVASLIDVTGRVVFTDNNFKSPYTLSTAALFPGVYFLRITSPSATQITKVEVTR